MPEQGGSRGFLTISQAARRLGVSQVTLRRWDAAGKFKARRHPINDYRMYRKGDVEQLKRRIQQGRTR